MISHQTNTKPRDSKRKLAVLGVLACLLTLLLAGLAAPFINAGQFSDEIRSSLEKSLGRTVEFEQAHFSLLSGPAFSLENVTIGEDPAFGHEAFAFVPTLRAHLRLDKLVAGQVRFTSLELDSPSLNFVKAPDGTWNLVQLLSRLSAPRRAPLNLFPTFQVSDGRIDFKFGTRKTVLYISDAELAIYPERSGKTTVRFSGSPSRTDRAGMGFGHFRGDLNWLISQPGRVDHGIEGKLTLDRSNLSELTTLMEGHDIGVHGTVSGILRVSGSAATPKLAGHLSFNDVHRWDLLPSRGEDWTVPYAGDLDLTSQTLDIRTASAESVGPAPIEMRVRVLDVLQKPIFSVVTEMREVPLGDLEPLAARMGLSLPKDIKLSGSLSGSVGFSSNGGWEGAVTASNPEVQIAGGPGFRAGEPMPVMISRNRIRFGQSALQTDQGVLQIGGEYDLLTGDGQTALSTIDVPVAIVERLSSGLISPDVLAMFTDGQVTGQFVFHSSTQDAPEMPGTTGQFEIKQATLTIGGLAKPVEHAEGHVAFSDSRFELDRFTGQVGVDAVRATYAYDASAKRPGRLKLVIDSTDIASVSSALAPALEGGGILAKLLPRSETRASRIGAGSLEGQLIVKKLSAATFDFGEFRTRFIWSGDAIDLTETRLGLPTGAFSGEGRLRLGYRPRWHFEGNISDIAWKGGTLDIGGEINSVGTGEAAIANLNARGTFEGENVVLASAGKFQSIAGDFGLKLDNGWPDIRLTKLVAVQDEGEWTGQGSTGQDGKLLVHLEREGRQIRIVSTLTGENVALLAPNRSGEK